MPSTSSTAIFTTATSPCARSRLRSSQAQTCSAFADTNGGTLTGYLAQIVADVRSRFDGSIIGIHTHNDSDVAVANALAAIENGASPTYRAA